MSCLPVSEAGHDEEVDRLGWHAGLRNSMLLSSRRRLTRLDCDWSSDVCSSDLKPLNFESSAVGHRVALGLFDENGDVFVYISSRGILGRNGHAIEDPKVVKAPLGLDDVAFAQEIGRASCRERV